MTISAIVAGFIFGTIGFSAFLYGKKQTLFRPMLIGIILMVYPYFISNTWVLYSVGVGLTVLLFVWQ